MRAFWRASLTGALILVLSATSAAASGLQWRKLTPVNGLPERGAFAAAALGGEAYVVGGQDKSGLLGDTFVRRSTGWEVIGGGAHVIPRRGALALSTASRVVLTGGRTATAALGDTLSLDPATGNWSLVAPASLWVPRFHHAGVSLPNGSLVLAGGASGSHAYLRDVFASHDGGAVWALISGTPSWTPRSGHAMAVVERPGEPPAIVLAGGYDAQLRADVHTSADGGATWRLLASAPSWAPRTGHAMAALPDGTLVLAGGASTSVLNDAFRSTDGGRTWTALAEVSAWEPRTHFALLRTAASPLLLVGGVTHQAFTGSEWAPACAPGAPLVAATCDACPVGTVIGATACEACAAGKHATPAQTCVDCGMGTYSTGSAAACSLCPVGTFSTAVAAVSATTCAACPAGATSAMGASACATCPAGQGANPTRNGTANCAPCPLGRFGADSVCSACGTGEYAGTTGTVTCSQCPAGKASARTAATAATTCAACGAGFRSGPGFGACYPCPTGQQATRNNTACEPCRPGTAAPNPPAPCRVCRPGYFTEATGAASCLPCPGGAAVATEGATSCPLCPAGTYSRPGSAECQPCPQGFTSLPGAVSCTAASSSGASVVTAITGSAEGASAVNTAATTTAATAAGSGAVAAGAGAVASASSTTTAASAAGTSSSSATTALGGGGGGSGSGGGAASGSAMSVVLPMLQTGCSMAMLTSSRAPEWLVDGMATMGKLFVLLPTISVFKPEYLDDGTPPGDANASVVATGRRLLGAGAAGGTWVRPSAVPVRNAAAWGDADRDGPVYTVEGGAWRARAALPAADARAAQWAPKGAAHAGGRRLLLAPGRDLDSAACANRTDLALQTLRSGCGRWWVPIVTPRHGVVRFLYVVPTDPVFYNLLVTILLATALCVVLCIVPVFLAAFHIGARCCCRADPLLLRPRFVNSIAVGMALRFWLHGFEPLLAASLFHITLFVSPKLPTVMSHRWQHSPLLLTLACFTALAMNLGAVCFVGSIQQMLARREAARHALAARLKRIEARSHERGEGGGAGADGAPEYDSLDSSDLSYLSDSDWVSEEDDSDGADGPVRGGADAGAGAGAGAAIRRARGREEGLELAPTAKGPSVKDKRQLAKARLSHILDESNVMRDRAKSVRHVRHLHPRKKDDSAACLCCYYCPCVSKRRSRQALEQEVDFRRRFFCLPINPALTFFMISSAYMPDHTGFWVTKLLIREIPGALAVTLLASSEVAQVSVRILSASLYFIALWSTRIYHSNRLNIAWRVLSLFELAQALIFLFFTEAADASKGATDSAGGFLLAVHALAFVCFALIQIVYGVRRIVRVCRNTKKHDRERRRREQEEASSGSSARV